MPQHSLEFTPGDIVRLTAAKDGNATDVSWRWVPPAGSSAPASTTNVLEWTTGANDAGVYDVEVTSPTASDSPGYGVIRLDVSTVDPDALAYLTAVEAADGQALEGPWRSAVNDFVVGCKADGIWNALEVCGIMMGARTLPGALVPLRGGAPSSIQNFVSGDYNRKMLKGNSVARKSFLSAFRPAASTENERAMHYSTYAEQFTMGGQLATHCGTSLVVDSDFFFVTMTCNGTQGRFSLFATDVIKDFLPGSPKGLLGASRVDDAGVSTIVPQGASEYNDRPVTFFTGTPGFLPVFAWLGSSGLDSHTSDGLSWYSFGRNLDLNKLQQRLDTLSAARAAAIPAAMRARTANGQFIADDPATPHVNEAWVVP